MDGTELKVRRLESGTDAGLYREIRLESLRLSPESFGSDYANESARPSEHFAGRLADFHVLGGFRGADLVGMAGFAMERGVRVAHKGLLWGVYVRPKARQQGVARLLVTAALAVAEGQAELVHLTVERGNLHARRLYIGLGFVEYGLEVNARKVGERYLDDVLMAKQLV